MRDWLQRRRLRIGRELRRSPRRACFSPATLAGDRAVRAALERFARGAVLDVGAGDMPYREWLAARVDSYQALDRQARAEGIDYLADVLHLDEVLEPGGFDTVLLLEVLEHLPEPLTALRQVHRVLKAGGRLILTAPHLSRLHELPDDYFRFTGEGLAALLTQAGFAVEQLEPLAGLLSFLGHQLSTLALAATWGLPAIGRLAFGLNEWLIARPAPWLDARLDRAHLFALGYLAVARRD